MRRRRMGYWSNCFSITQLVGQIDWLYFVRHGDYYSLKIFRLWLVKTTCIIHHNQLLLNKFGKNFVILNQWCQNFCHVESMMSKVQPSAGYWTVDRENLRTRLLFLMSKKTAKWRISNEEIFRMNNKAIIEFGFRRIWRILLDLQNSSNPTHSHSITDNYWLEAKYGYFMDSQFF